MLAKEEKERLADFFESWELAEFLQTKVEDFIDAFEDEIEEALEDLDELMGVKRGRADRT